MSSSHSQDPVLSTVDHDHPEDHAHEQPHDQATEVAHAWEHFRENARFFAGFFSIVLLTVISFTINFGSWNLVVALFLAAARTALIAYFLSTLFKNFSFVFRTLFFTAIFLGGMIWLSLWDSTIKSGWVGNPITLPTSYHDGPVESSSN
jgi:hypothetical protein